MNYWRILSEMWYIQIWNTIIQINSKNFSSFNMISPKIDISSPQNGGRVA